MTIEIPKEKQLGKVLEVTLGATPEHGGTRSHEVKLGGNNTLPFHFFEGDSPNKPLVAMEVFDKPPAKYPDYLKDFYLDAWDKPGEMAKKCVDEFGAELISVRLDGTHPEKGNKSADQAVEVVKQVLECVSVPIIISGHSHYEKINIVMKKVAEASAGENCLLNFVETDNYKTIAAACMAYQHSLVAQSPIDINLAKQLNILLTDMSFPADKIIMDPLTGTLGYGLEYTYSIMERIRLDALAGDEKLMFPMLVNPGYESFRVKETRVPEQEYPEWGDENHRGAYWEIATTMSLLVAGADLLIMYHPEAVNTVKSKILEFFQPKTGEIA